jgi:hypothetical protein
MIAETTPQVLTGPMAMGTITNKTMVNRGHIQWGEHPENHIV